MLDILAEVGCDEGVSVINLEPFHPDSFLFPFPTRTQAWRLPCHRAMSQFWTTKPRVVAFFKFSIGASLASAGAWQLWTTHCYFESFGPDNDPLFQSQYFEKHNPGNHPSLNDSCVRKVPLSQIPPSLVDDALNGGSRLVEHFCAGVWGGYGMYS